MILRYCDVVLVLFQGGPESQIMDHGYIMKPRGKSDLN